MENKDAKKVGILKNWIAQSVRLQNEDRSIMQEIATFIEPDVSTTTNYEDIYSDLRANIPGLAFFNFSEVSTDIRDVVDNSAGEYKRKLDEHFISQFINSDLSWINIVPQDSSFLEGDSALVNDQRSASEAYNRAFRHTLDQSNFYEEIKHSISDLTTYGFCALSVRRDADEHIMYRSEDVHRIWFLEDSMKRVDRVFVYTQMSLAEVLRAYPSKKARLEEHVSMQAELAISKKKHPSGADLTPEEKQLAIAEYQANFYITVLECYVKENGKWECFFFDPSSEIILKQKTYSYQPIVVCRLDKKRGLVGSSFGLRALVPAKYANELKQQFLYSVDLSNRIAYVLPSDEQVERGELDQYGVFYFEDPQMRPSIETPSLNTPISQDAFMMLKEEIRSIMKSDQIDFNKKERLTVSEVQEYAARRNNALSPYVKTIIHSLLKPVMMHTLKILESRAVLKRPDVLRDLKLTFQSPILSASKLTRSANLSRFLEQALPLIQADPALGEKLDIINIVKEFALSLDVYDIVLSEEEAQENRAANITTEDQLRLAQAQKASAEARKIGYE